jgi:hypothetical protein
MLPLIGLAAGLSGGYRQSKERERERIRQEKDDAWQEEQRNIVRTQQKREAAMQTGLQEAAAPATVAPVEGSVLPPDQVGPSLALYRVKGNGIDQTTSDQAAATKSLADYNAPEAVATRQAGVLRAAGAPDKAMTLENAVVSRKRADEAYEAEKAERARKLKEEGVFNAVRAFRAGDATGLAQAFNAGGEYKIDGTPEITRDDREIPGFGKVPAYTAKIRIVGPDGKVQEKVYNSHDLSMQMMPYEKALEIQRKGTDSENKTNYQKEMLDTKIKQLELAGQVAEAKALRAAANGGTVGREERLRFTTLFSDAGRRMSEAQQSLSRLQADPSFMRRATTPGTEQALQVAQLTEAIKSYGEERKMYQGLLVGSQVPPGSEPAPGAQPNPPSPATGKPAAPGKSGTPSYSNLWK